MTDIARIRALDLTKPLAKPVTNDLGVGTVINRWSDYPSFNLTPQRLRSILWQADQGYMRYLMELFGEMEEKDGHLGSILQTRKLAVTGLPLEIQAASKDAKDQEIAAFVEEQLTAIPDFNDDLGDLLDAISKGYSATEIHWDYRNKTAVVADLEWIEPKCISFVNSAIPLIITEANGAGAPPPPWKTIFHQYRGRSGDVCRAGMLRPCALPYLLKSFNWKFWAIFSEIFGMPVRVGKYNQTASTDDRRALKDALKSLGTDAYAVISENTIIEFLESGKGKGGNVIPYEAFIEVCNKEMSKAILGQTLTTESSPGSGTLAGNAHENVRQDIVRADAISLAAVLRSQLVRPLVGFQYGWEAPLPNVVFVIQEAIDFKMESEGIKNFVEAGLPIGVNHCYQRYGIPKPEKDEEVLKPPAQIPAAAAPAGPEEKPEANQPPAAMKEVILKAVAAIATQQELENLTQAASAEAQDYLAQMLAPVMELIESGESLEVIRDKLLGLYERIDTRSLDVLMAQVRIMANLRGRVNE